jgi:hypothetical protein
MLVNNHTELTLLNAYNRCVKLTNDRPVNTLYNSAVQTLKLYLVASFWVGNIPVTHFACILTTCPVCRIPILRRYINRKQNTVYTGLNRICIVSYWSRKAHNNRILTGPDVGACVSARNLSQLISVICLEQYAKRRTQYSGIFSYALHWRLIFVQQFEFQYWRVQMSSNSKFLNTRQPFKMTFVLQL